MIEQGTLKKYTGDHYAFEVIIPEGVTCIGAEVFRGFEYIQRIRPFTVGRKNWLFCDTPGGAQASATVYTMVEMAKAHGLNVEKYLAFLLERRPHAGMTDDELEKLVPWSDEARGACDYAQQITCV